jgi:hypothetical protein
VAGRLSKSHMRCIKEEDDKSNKQIMDKLLNTDVSICVILVNAITFIVFSLLREDPLSTCILEVFFPKNPIMCLFF